MNRQLLRYCALALLSLNSGAALPQLAHEPQTSQPQAAQATRRVEALTLFQSKAQPLLKGKCFPCHGGGQTFSKLDLTTRGGMLKGGTRGPAVVPGNSSQSQIIAALEGRGQPMMPFGTDKKLPDDVIDAFRKWIDGGAPWVEDKSAAAQKPEWSYEPENLWAFQPVHRPRVPSVPFSPKAVHNPVDAFVFEKLSKKDLRPAPPADRVTLIRRATFDLIGLPPTPAEVQAFVDDKSPDAFRKVVEGLLASPRYGERWGRHWLDVVRYADTDGYSNDYERPNAWRYRDYVISGFNQDKPYDRFILEQIAGDELDPQNPENLIATGFLRMGPWEQTAMSVAAVTRQAWLDDVTHNTAATFLGLSVGCARCHDHKFDPIPTRDYYRLQAIFASTEFAQRPAPFLPSENQASFATDSARVEALVHWSETRLEKLREKVRQSLLVKYGVKDVSALPAGVLKEGMLKQEALTSDDLEHQRIYQKRLDIYRRQLDRYRPLAYSVTRETTDAKKMEPETFILVGGSLRSPGEKVEPGVLSVAFRFEKSAPPDIPSSMAGRRLALARWIASPENPLTARVLVNRIWQYHFGRGIAANANNFGKMGKKPTHPELLDWLADYFIKHGWSVKEMHRVIMLSATYQQAPAPVDPKNAAQLDPDNELISYFNPQRMESEVLRDTILAVSGQLSLDAADIGGPGTFPEINEDVAQQPRLIMGTLSPVWHPSPTRRERNRRTIYTYQKRSILNPMLEVFNEPNQSESCEWREATTVPLQAFTLLNSKFVRDMALAFAVRLQQISHDRNAQVDEAFRLAFNRLPTAKERAMALAHLTRMAKEHRQVAPPRQAEREPIVRSLIGELTGNRFDYQEEANQNDYEENLDPSQVSPETRALADLALVLFNTNEFVYVY